MSPTCVRARTTLLIVALLALILSGSIAGCGRDDRFLLPRSQTWAELRTVRRAVTVTPPRERARAPYPRERLVDGETIDVSPEGLAWIRRDGGATLLVRGPARLTLRADSIELAQGRVFIDTPAVETTDIETPSGPLHLAHVRASIDVRPAGAPGTSGAAETETYVLAGEVRTDGAARATAGERLVVRGERGAPKATIEPALAWDDWTGGLATTDRAAEPAPFGIGTVGARLPGEQGSPRSALAIQRLDVRVSVDRDLAITEVDETFFNPSSEVVEGVYRFRTPEGATLHRFGVDREGAMVWGHVKEKQAAAAQYQANVYQGSKEDPALLEWDAPGVYRARLYPIGPGESRRVVVRYAEWLGRTGEKGERRLYVYPMAAEGPEASLPVIEELTVEVDLARAGAKEVRTGMSGVREGTSVMVREHDFVPRADLAIELFDLGVSAPGGYSAPHAIDYSALPPADRGEARRRAKDEADYVLVTVRPEDIPLKRGGLDLAVVIDASAATEPASLAVARAAAAALLAHLGGDDRVGVWTGDTALRPVLTAEGAGAAGSASSGRSALRPIDEAGRRAILRSLATIERGGATDLGAMLSEAAAALDPERRGAVVYIGDATPTVGELSLLDVRERLARLPRPVRIFGLGVGDSANMGLLKGIARGALAERITDGNEAARAALRLLEYAERPALLGASIDLGPSVERVYPRDLGAVVADESVVVIGRAPVSGMPTSIALTGPTGAVTRLPLAVTPVEDLGDLTRRWAEGRLAQTMDEGAGRAAMVDLGVRHGIITPVTSLYVPTTKEMSPEEREELERAKRAAKSGGRRAGSLWDFRKSDEDGEAPAEKEETEVVAENSADNKEGGTGTRAKGEEGSMGAPTRATGNRYGVQGPPDPQSAREAALRDAQEFGMIGLLTPNSSKEFAAPSAAPAASASAAPNDQKAPSAPWGRDDSQGNDPMSARGNMWGNAIGDTPDTGSNQGDAFGAGGLGLSGAGEGGGGKGEGLGLGSIGSIGRGAGTGSGQGYGSGHGRLGGAHMTRPPQVKAGQATVSGRLPPEIISRIVRQNFGRFRLCYENGLRANPNLQGRVAVRFVINTDGAVGSVANGGSDMPDAGVVSCVARAFSGLSFPMPEEGRVTVTFPIMFTPEGGSASPGDAEEAKAKAKANEGAGSGDAQRAKAGDGQKVAITVRVDDVPHKARLCGDAAGVPFEERIILWRERLARNPSNWSAVANVYHFALRSCEAPTWRERSKLLSMMLDAIPSAAGRVALWRSMQADTGAADTLYRGMLARVRTAQQARELHEALGLKVLDPGVLERAIKEAKTPEAQVAKLRSFAAEWPDDFQLALRLLDALEDAGDVAGARALGRALRARPDADARLRTAVGELSLRLAARAGDPAQKALDEAEALRAFGEIVEFAPDDPVARRRLGDLLRAHGWFEAAARQYQTLATLAPDDSSVALLLAAAAEGLGKLEEAVRWTEKGGSAGAPDVEQSPAFTARAFAATYLAWGCRAAQEAGRADEARVLSARLARALSDSRSAGRRGPRVTLTWAHPELHPTLWSNALGAPMPAREGDVTLGIEQVILPEREGTYVEVRVEPDEVEHAARLGAVATLTVVFDDTGSAGSVLTMPVTFARGGPATQRFVVAGRQIRPGGR